MLLRLCASYLPVCLCPAELRLSNLFQACICRFATFEVIGVFVGTSSPLQYNARLATSDFLPASWTSIPARAFDEGSLAGPGLPAHAAPSPLGSRYTHTSHPSGAMPRLVSGKN